ncbi:MULTISPECIES: hypothetical protein [Brevibacterium]|uniref:Uncharacterized protein n=2 Tax=Brevibacterium linens TaxID=1703 RepID=A0A2H1HQ73_BRELN|nr:MULTISPECIES: hypothetical protein [Brevibacterium]AZU00796.1 hypothetical protein CXR29_08870 [Brevibacterium linens]KAB1947606.1 hypothetical protein F8227_08680 [Brevibacterium linens ATCC 9172]SMX65093.1 hypothetical protein BLIN101_00382 [Brevibacterium linens]SMX88482.1 hypothetical protein BLIN9172_02290 [Brevibacterium linens ATCC 9172]
MSSHREPLEPDDVIDATAKTPTERARRVAGRAYSAASTGVRNVREATSTSRLIEVGENGVNRALGSISHAIDDAVRSGKVERAFDRAQETVTTGADGVRKLVTRKPRRP